MKFESPNKRKYTVIVLVYVRDDSKLAFEITKQSYNNNKNIYAQYYVKIYFSYFMSCCYKDNVQRCHVKVYANI